MDQWRWDWYGNDRWYDGWYQSPSGLWRHPDRRWSGWGRPPWYPRDRKAVLDANGNRVVPNTQQVEGWGHALEAIDAVTATYQNVPNTQVEGYNPQEDAGNVPERDALARVRMDIGVPWGVAVAIEGAEAEGAAVAAEDIRLSWRMANEYNTISESDDEEAEAEDNVAGATEAEDHDSWTTEQSRDAAESLSSAGSFILEPSSRSGWRRAREEGARDEDEAEDSLSTATGDENEAAVADQMLEQFADQMLGVWNGGQLRDTDLHQAASPPPPQHTKAAPPPRPVVRAK